MQCPSIVFYLQNSGRKQKVTGLAQLMCGDDIFLLPKLIIMRFYMLQLTFIFYYRFICGIFSCLDYKMSQYNTFPFSFPEPKVPSFNCFCSKPQKTSVFNDIKQRKAANAHICFPFVLNQSGNRLIISALILFFMLILNNMMFFKGYLKPTLSQYAHMYIIRDVIIPPVHTGSEMFPT